MEDSGSLELNLLTNGFLFVNVRTLFTRNGDVSKTDCFSPFPICFNQKDNSENRFAVHKADTLMNFLPERADRLAVFRGTLKKLSDDI